MASVQERVIDIVAEQLGVDKEKVTPETSFVNDLGADSLDTVELVMELEEEFDITFPTMPRKRFRPSARRFNTSRSSAVVRHLFHETARRRNRAGSGHFA